MNGLTSPPPDLGNASDLEHMGLGWSQLTDDLTPAIGDHPQLPHMMELAAVNTGHQEEVTRLRHSDAGYYSTLTCRPAPQRASWSS